MEQLLLFDLLGPGALLFLPFALFILLVGYIWGKTNVNKKRIDELEKEIADLKRK